MSRNQQNKSSKKSTIIGSAIVLLVGLAICLPCTYIVLHSKVAIGSSIGKLRSVYYALEAYQDDHDQYPEKLEELYPAYIDTSQLFYHYDRTGPIALKYRKPQSADSLILYYQFKSGDITAVYGGWRSTLVRKAEARKIISNLVESEWNTFPIELWQQEIEKQNSDEPNKVPATPDR